VEDLVPFVDGSDLVYHCAAELEEPSAMQALNVEATQKLFRAARGRIGRWVQLSSVGVYGSRWHGRQDESTVPAPQNDYERSKLAADLWLQAESRDAVAPVVIVQPSTVFANDMPNESLFQLFAAIRRGLFCYIGSKRAIMNYVHADSVLAALVLCGHHPAAAGDRFIVSESLDIGRFASIVAERLGCRRPSMIVPEPVARGLAGLAAILPHFPLTKGRIEAMTNRCLFADDRIRQRLGYTSTAPLEDSLRQLVDYFASPAFAQRGG
jgi:nucleoside-diphosphate-sugar epimerase